MTQDLSIFLVANGNEATDQLYWFGRQTPVVTQATIFSEVQHHAAAAEPDAQQRITEFLADPNQKLSAPLGNDRRARTLQLQRAKHHRD